MPVIKNMMRVDTRSPWFARGAKDDVEVLIDAGILIGITIFCRQKIPSGTRRDAEGRRLNVEERRFHQ
jgi:hypothetical protein